MGGRPTLACLEVFVGVEMEGVPECLNGDALSFADNGICLGDWALCIVIQFVHVASASVTDNATAK